ncbi:MAG: carboxypeptidase regulatory-like domain-containing protein [Planctomycetes bacterium]|nr:carboxypeptidase regulatory-like domain-containing protein [Planctomycetota bacterium]
MTPSSKRTWALVVAVLVVVGLLAWKLRIDGGQGADALDHQRVGAESFSLGSVRLQAPHVESSDLMVQSPSVAKRSLVESEPSAAQGNQNDCTLRGRVVDWDGEPVDWFWISAFDPSRIHARVSTQFSESNGEFSIPHLAAGVWVVRATGGQDSMSVRVKVTLPDDPFVELICVADARISGVVYHPSGVELAGAEVSFGGGESDDQVVTVSGEGGMFLLKELPRNGYLLNAHFGDSVLPEPLVLDSLPGTQAKDVQLHLVLGGRLTGLVLDVDGKAEAATTVEVKRVAFGDLFKVVCDAEGKFELPPLSPDLYLVQVMESTPSVRRRSALVEVLAGEITNVVLQEKKVDMPVYVHGTVTLRGEPMAGEVFAFPYGHDLSTGGVRSGQIQEGRFELELPHAGRYLLRTQTAMGRTSPFVVDVPLQKSWDVHLELPGGQISGTLTFAQGEPAGKRFVLLDLAGSHNLFSNASCSNYCTFPKSA